MSATRTRKGRQAPTLEPARPCNLCHGNEGCFTRLVAGRREILCRDRLTPVPDYTLLDVRDGFGVHVLEEFGHTPEPNAACDPRGLTNFTEEPVPVEGSADRTRLVRIGLSGREVQRRLYRLTGGWPRRVGPRLFVPTPDHRLQWLDTPAALFAYIGSAVTPAGVTANAVDWRDRGTRMVSRTEFFAHLGQSATCYEAVELFPHHPPLPDHFYCHPPAEGGDGSALAGLLDRYRPASAVDADLLRACFLTLVWGGPAGQRPAFLFTARPGDPKGGVGVGKSTVAKHIALLMGGAVDVKEKSDTIADVKTRLLSADGMSKRVVLFDNVKQAKFGWADLEGLVTALDVSGHVMYWGEGQRPNHLVYLITLNGASLSRDMAQRCVIIQLDRPKFTDTWEADAEAYIDAHRWAILGDLLSTLRCRPRRLSSFTRWAAWEGQVLARVSDPAACQAAIAERQGEVDEDTDEEHRVREAFAEALQSCDLPPDDTIARFAASAVTEAVSRATGVRASATAATGLLKAKAIAELRKADVKGGRYWMWAGKGVPAGQTCRLLIRFDPAARRFVTADMPG